MYRHCPCIQRVGGGQELLWLTIPPPLTGSTSFMATACVIPPPAYQVSHLCLYGLSCMIAHTHCVHMHVHGYMLVMHIHTTHTHTLHACTHAHVDTACVVCVCVCVHACVYVMHIQTITHIRAHDKKMFLFWQDGGLLEVDGIGHEHTMTSSLFHCNNDDVIMHSWIGQDLDRASIVAIAWLHAQSKLIHVNTAVCILQVVMKEELRGEHVNSRRKKRPRDVSGKGARYIIA